MEHEIDTYDNSESGMILSNQNTFSQYSSCASFFSKISILLRIIWILCCIVIFFTTDISSIIYWLLLIIIYSMSTIYCEIMDINSETSNLKMNIYRLIYFIKIFMYCILFVGIIFIVYDTYIKMYVIIFFSVFFLFEYLIFFLLVIGICAIACCFARRFYPFLLTVSNSNLVIPIMGIADSDLEKLNYCKYENGEIICLKNTPVLNESYNNYMSCIICQDDYKDLDDIIIMDCHHHYHKKCGIAWLKINKTCPNCRKPI